MSSGDEITNFKNTECWREGVRKPLKGGTSKNIGGEGGVGRQEAVRVTLRQNGSPQIRHVYNTRRKKKEETLVP